MVSGRNGSVIVRCMLRYQDGRVGNNGDGSEKYTRQNKRGVSRSPRAATGSLGNCEEMLICMD